jgi:hypothetical protein
MSKPQQVHFQQIFDSAERELRRIVGGSLDSRQFYGVLGVIHTLAEQASRRQ